MVDLLDARAFQLGGVAIAAPALDSLILAPSPLLIHQQAQHYTGSCSCAFKASAMPRSRMVGRSGRAVHETLTAAQVRQRDPVPPLGNTGRSARDSVTGGDSVGGRGGSGGV